MFPSPLDRWGVLLSPLLSPFFFFSPSPSPLSLLRFFFLRPDGSSLHCPTLSLSFSVSPPAFLQCPHFPIFGAGVSFPSLSPVPQSIPACSRWEWRSAALSPRSSGGLAPHPLRGSIIYKLYSALPASTRDHGLHVFSTLSQFDDYICKKKKEKKRVELGPPC